MHECFVLYIQHLTQTLGKNYLYIIYTNKLYNNAIQNIEYIAT